MLFVKGEQERYRYSVAPQGYGVWRGKGGRGCMKVGEESKEIKSAYSLACSPAHQDKTVLP